MTVFEQLVEFISECEDRLTFNKWIVDDDMQVYIRKGLHVLGSDNKINTCLDIASIQVETPRQGIGTRFINKAHETNPWDATYVENAHNPFLDRWLERNGWERIQGNSFFKRTLLGCVEPLPIT